MSFSAEAIHDLQASPVPLSSQAGTLAIVWPTGKRPGRKADGERCFGMTGRHEGTVTGWEFLHLDGRRRVILELRSDDDAQLSALLLESDPEQGDGELSRLIAAVLQCQHPRPQWMSGQSYLHMLCNQLVGRRMTLNGVGTVRVALPALDGQPGSPAKGQGAHGSVRASRRRRSRFGSRRF